MTNIKNCSGNDLSELSDMVFRIESELDSYLHLENLCEYSRIKKLVNDLIEKIGNEYDKRQENY